VCFVEGPRVRIAGIIPIVAEVTPAVVEELHLDDGTESGSA